MRRDEIVRRDFPTALRGWDPEAVTAHLDAVARRVEEQPTSLAALAGERVREIVEAAERQAAQIEAEARQRAEEVAAAARREAQQTIERGRERANEQAEEARTAISDLVAQAERLRERISDATPGGSPAVPIAGAPRPTAEVEPGPVIVPEPEPPREPEPGPVPVPEPEPPLEPEPEPPDIPEPSPDPPDVPAPSPEPPAPEQPVAADGDSTAAADKSAARLVAMKMALDGASREEIDRHLAENYSLDHREQLLDDVLARAKA
jgi:hypothetical protein